MTTPRLDPLAPTREANAQAWDAYHAAAGQSITEQRRLEAVALKAFEAHKNAIEAWETKPT